MAYPLLLKMFYEESMIVFFTILILLSFFIYKSSIDKANLLFVAIVFAVMAFFQEVNSDSDLIVAFRHLDGIRQDGWQYFYSEELSSNVYFSGRELLKVYFYILSFFPCNNFYSAISIFFIYYLSLTSVLKACLYYRITPATIKFLLILLIWLIDFFDGSNGVRNMLAFSIFVYALIDDFLLGKSNKRKVLDWCLYIASAMIHSAAWLLIIIRLLIPLMNSKRILIVTGVAILIWSFSLQFIAPFLSRSDNIIFNALNHLLSAYTTSEQSAIGNFAVDNFNNGASYLLIRSFRVIHIVLMIYIFSLLFVKAVRLSYLPKFIFLLACFCLGSTSSNVAANVLTRYSFVMIFLTPIFYAYYDAKPVRKKYFGPMENCALCLLIVAVLFNYYMFRYHYYHMHFGLTIY